MTVRVPVHCCCHPSKRLGYVELPRELVKWGAINFLAMPALTSGRTAAGDCAIIQGKAIRTSIEALVVGGRVGELAVKSNHEPIEVWRRVKGFVEDQADLDG
jgi:hypothetical protein